MTNLRNTGTVIGRLTRDVNVFSNKDGSRKVTFTLAVKDNFKTSNGEVPTQFVALEGFVPASQKDLGVYEFMHKGDEVGAMFTVKSSAYKNDKGEDQYRQYLAVTAINLMESKATTTARQAKAAAVAEAVEKADA